ncbi:unnamed protein product [Symbiodinium sp. CCMP2592]|nr:unnamed protein product [Symbiodinium sp. CCMP2592]
MMRVVSQILLHVALKPSSAFRQEETGGGRLLDGLDREDDWDDHRHVDHHGGLDLLETDDDLNTLTWFDEVETDSPATEIKVSALRFCNKLFFEASAGAEVQTRNLLRSLFLVRHLVTLYTRGTWMKRQLPS